MEGKTNWLLSDGFLGALVVLLSVLTAYTAYQRALVDIEGDDLDLEAQSALALAVGSYLADSTEYLGDVHAYDGYRLLLEEDEAEAVAYLDRSSAALRAGLERPGGPFDEAYVADKYREAQSLIEEAQEFQESANLADERSRLYEMAGLVFAIGLAAAAWTSLVGSGRRIRGLFLLIAFASLLIGIGVIVQIQFT